MAPGQEEWGRGERKSGGGAAGKGRRGAEAEKISELHAAALLRRGMRLELTTHKIKFAKRIS